ncbi:MAG: hypothetical protein C4586_05860 [Anaerolineaceae bacterium]|nr:MAG: hypothetical protein C4586_05860 [Anaerolineaceae bacterium]
MEDKAIEFTVTDQPTLKELERRYFVAVMKVVDHDIAKAAQILGLTRSGVYSKIRTHKIEHNFKRPQMVAKYRNGTATEIGSDSRRYSSPEGVPSAGVQTKQGPEKSV